VPARLDVDFLRWRDHHLFTHVANDFVEHDHDRNAVLLGEIERLDRQVKRFLGELGQSAMIE